MTSWIIMCVSILVLSNSTHLFRSLMDRDPAAPPEGRKNFVVRILPSETMDDDELVVLSLNPKGGISTLSGIPVTDEKMRELIEDLTKNQTKPLHIRLQMQSDKDTSAERLGVALKRLKDATPPKSSVVVTVRLAALP
jgi:hypothetical protein